MQDNAHARAYACGAHVVSPATRRLERNGDKVDIEAKVFDLILLLVENRDRALDKQEIVTALWGTRPVTDAALSQLVYKARRAFDDDGGQQAVIRTVYGHGLQWVAPTIEVPVVEAPTEAARQPADAPATSAGVDAAAVPAGLLPPRTLPHRRRRQWWLGAAALAVLVLLSAWIIPHVLAPPAPPPPRLAVLPVQNATGDATLDWTTRGLPGLIASLLGETTDLDVVDPLQANRAWNLTPANGRSRLQQARYATHAGILVSGKLEKMADKLYQLTLRVDTGAADGATGLVVSGADPGAIGLAAVPRLRRVLQLEASSTPSLKDRPQDAYLAETFARGLDSAARGDWPGAKLHFALVAKGEPRFLPARYRLAQAQLRTDEHQAGESTLQAVLADALRREQPAMAALVLDEQAYLATLRNAYASALELLGQARLQATRARRPEIQAAIAIGLTKAHASLGQVDAAEREWQSAQALVAANGLRQLEPRLHNARVFIANGRRDFVALEAAARDGLAANEALGDERNSVGAVLNIAYAMENQGRGAGTLPLWQRVWTWGQRQRDYQMQSLAGYHLARRLLAAGLDDRAARINDALLEAAVGQDDRPMQSLALRTRAGLQLGSGDAMAALRTCRQASALIDAANDPIGKLRALVDEAYAAYIAQPDALASLQRDTEALIAARAATPAERFVQQQIRAMAEAVAGDLSAARAALEVAAQLAASAQEYASLRQVALHIAMQSGDEAIAAFGLQGTGVDDATDATFLGLLGDWAARKGDEASREQALARQAALRENALQLLADAPP